MKQWLLIDQYNSTISHKNIWQYSSPKLYYLFENTLISHYQDQGPILLSGNISRLIEQYRTSPQQWASLVLKGDENTSDEQILLHLRNLLFVTYPPERKGVVTYYDARTAYYFFSYTEQEQLSRWLGPIEEIEWFGGSWQQQANAQLHWQKITQSYNKSSTAIEQYTNLTEGQQQGLTLARQHKYTYDWSMENQQDFESTYKHLQEAMYLDFDDLEYLEQYLKLRAEHPLKLIPMQLAGETAQQRLQNLENFWNTNGQI